MTNQETPNSLATFDENNPRATISSPRSIKACKTEGVLPRDLIFKPIEAFQEKNLSPRLVKLRFDFFEAKRRDLLAASRRARESLVADEAREKGASNSQLDVLASQSGLTKGAIMAMNSDGLKQERQKLLRAQEKERDWLKNALNIELAGLKKLEASNQMLTEQATGDAEEQIERARKTKELNDKRQQEEERKAMEAEARQKLEKQIAKEEFHKNQIELEKKGREEAKKQKEAYERQVAEMERKKQKEIEKEQAREQAAEEQEARKAEMRAQDLRRMDIMDQQKVACYEAMGEKKEKRDIRIYQSIQANQEIEAKRRDDFEERQRHSQIREERLMQARAVEQEEGAKRSFQTMMKRKVIQEEAARKAEDRRLAILESQEETELRLLEHEQKKERYLDFKHELDGLRGKNKEINVERQRRREEHARETVADQVRKKDEKIDALNNERRRLWEIRRTAQGEAYRARELVKNEIMRQRVASKYNSKALEAQLNSLMNHDIFTPKVLQSSTSLPLLQASMGQSQQGVEAL